MEYIFLEKSVFLIKKRILVIGDIHIGFEDFFLDKKTNQKNNSIEKTINEIKKIILEIKKRKYIVEKIIFLGDICDSFRSNKERKKDFLKLFNFLKNYFSEKNIIFIKGNHDFFDPTPKKNIKKYHIEKEILFIHGDKKISNIKQNKIKIIFSAHLHPFLYVEKNKNLKKGFYKCFLKGTYKNKKIIILPSFFELIEGTPLNEYDYFYIESFSFLPKKDILDFEIFVFEKDKIFQLGKVKDLFLEE